jgi:nucleoside-diphosphate-sugar epimerase
MKIALTGAAGRIGGLIAPIALATGHSIVAIDRRRPEGFVESERLRFIEAQITDYDALLAAFEGCDALIHMAAIPTAFRDPDHVVHNNNVVGSYNAMRAAVEHGITRICQASSVNAIGLSYSREGHFDYFPIDEQHPDRNEEPYGLSKWICEQQANSLVRRYDDLSIASIRFHWVLPDVTPAAEEFNLPDQRSARHLWGYTLDEPAARACLLALTADFKGHEAFYIVAPITTNPIPSLELARTWFPNVPVRGDLSGNKSFFSSAKAERILGWRHN